MSYAVKVDVKKGCDFCECIEWEKYEPSPDDLYVEINPRYIFFPFGIEAEQQTEVKSNTDWEVI